MGQENDELRYRFTAWMQVVVKRAKIDYLRRMKAQPIEVSIEHENVRRRLSYEPTEYIDEVDGNFVFENSCLEALYKKLSPGRRRILELLYIHNYAPEEVAEILHCCVRNVYNQRSLILKELREKMNKEN